MGLGPSKKPSLDSQSDVKPVRASRQSSEYSIKSERFVSPPTFPIPGFHSFDPVDGAQLKTKPAGVNQTPVDTKQPAVNQKVSYANATELEKRLNKLQHERASSIPNEVSTSKAQHHRQGKEPQRLLKPTQKQEQNKFSQKQQEKIQQVHQLSQKKPQQKQQEQQNILVQHQQSQKQQQHQYEQQSHPPTQCTQQKQQQQQKPQQPQQQPQKRPVQQKQQQPSTIQQYAQHQPPQLQQQLQQSRQEQSQRQPLQQTQLKKQGAEQEQQLELLNQRKPNLPKPKGQHPAHQLQQGQRQEFSQKRLQQHQQQQQHLQQQLQPNKQQDPQQDSTQDDRKTVQESASGKHKQSQQNQPRSEQDKELTTQPTKQQAHKSQNKPASQPKKPQQHQKDSEVQRQCSKGNRGSTEQQDPNSDHLDTPHGQQQNHKIQQRQQENQPVQQQPMQQSMQHQQSPQVVQEQQENQQQQQHNQVQNHRAKKTKKQLKRERLRVLQEQQSGKNTTHDEQQTQPQQDRQQAELLADQTPLPQFQLNQQIQLQCKGSKDQETLKVEVQPDQKLIEQQTKRKEPAHRKQAPDQPRLQQILTDETTKKQDQHSQTQQKDNLAINKEQDNAIKQATVKPDLASTYTSKQGLKSTVQNDCVSHAKTQQGKPVPLIIMTINFTSQGPSNPISQSQPSRKLETTVDSSKQKNQKKPLHVTPSNTGTAPQSLQSNAPLIQTPRSTNSSRLKEPAPDETPQKVDNCKQVIVAPRKQSSRAASKIGSQNPGQFDHLEQEKLKVQARKEQDKSQQHQLQEQQQKIKPKQHAQLQLKQNLLQEEQKIQRPQQTPQKKHQQLQQRLQQEEHQQQSDVDSRTRDNGIAQGREKLKAVYNLQPHPPAFEARAAALQAQLALNPPTQSTHTARKHKSVAGGATMEIFKTLQAQDVTSAPQTNAGSSGAQMQQSVASWAVVCDHMPEQDSLNKPSTDGTSKKEQREGQGFFSRIFGRKIKAGPTTIKQQKTHTMSPSPEELSTAMQALRIDSASSIHEIESPAINTDQAHSDTDDQSSSSSDDEGSFSAESDDSSDQESCMEAWGITNYVVEKALCLLPIQVGTVHSRRFTLPDCPFEPEIVQRLVSDALEAKRGLKLIKEDQMLLTAFRDCLLKFFEEKEITDVLPPCNHPPGSNQCNMQPVIQPLVGIIRHVLREKNEPPKKAARRPEQNRKGQEEHAEQRPRRFIKIKRKLPAGKTLRTPTKLLVRFCHACGDSRQPNGQPLFTCGRCQDVVYCSRECQNVDWITHRFTCPGGDRHSNCKHHTT